MVKTWVVEKKQQDAGERRTQAWEMAQSAQKRVGADSHPEAQSLLSSSLSRSPEGWMAGTGDAAKDLICLLRGRDPFFELNLFSLFQGGPHCDDIADPGDELLVFRAQSAKARKVTELEKS
jgi:hypothetical protein